MGSFYIFLFLYKMMIYIGRVRSSGIMDCVVCFFDFNWNVFFFGNCKMEMFVVLLIKYRSSIVIM